MIAVNKKIGLSRVTFTPAFYRRAYEAYKRGNHRELIAMMKEAETDSLVSGCIQGRRAGYMQDLHINPYDPDNSADQERADWYRSLFKQLKLRSLFKAIISAKKYKYSVIDFTWEIDENHQVPVSFEAFDQKYFTYDPGDDNKLKIDFGRKDLRDIPEETLVCESEDMPFMLPVLRDYILKEFGLEAWASFIENFGEAFIIGYYPPGAGDEFKKDVDDAVNSIAASSRGSAPKGTEVEIKESNRSTGDHKDFKETCDTGISISILGHANAVQQSSGMSVGENQAPFKPMEFISIDDLYFVDECMDQLIKIIHDRNFGDGRYPSAMTSKPDQMGLDLRMKVLDMTWRHGGIIPPSEYAKLGIHLENEDPLQRTDPFRIRD